jgi:hypothetical protein
VNIQRDDVVAALTAEEVVRHLGIKGTWRGRWMRSRRCGETDHDSLAFGIARDGHWHCHSCDKGGDLLMLLALSEGLSAKDDFPKVLELAAGIAGVEASPGGDLFGLGPTRPTPRPRPEMPELPPLAERVALAKRRAAWAWERLQPSDSGIAHAYLKSRGLDPAVVLSREPVRSTPLSISKELRAQIDERAPNVSPELRTLWWTMGTRKGTLSIVFPVRSSVDGALVDLRARRLEPAEGQPKIIGMVGGVTEAPAERGKTRQLIGCYGHPHAIDADHVVLVEGALDYATALQVWPEAQVVGAVNAGSLALVAAHVAAALASRDSTSRLTIVEQCDPPRQLKDGRVVAGAADASINEDPNAATKVALRLLGHPNRVGWLFCDMAGVTVDGKPVKDLNDLVRAGVDVRGLHRWWSDPDAGAAGGP